VRLIRGEAMFDVAKDHKRPFFVSSEFVGVLAVGTEFRVSRRGGEDVVAVTEGTVAIYKDGRKEIEGPMPTTPAEIAAVSGGLAVTAGEQVSVAKSKPALKQKVNIDYELAWADGWLTYEDMTIAEVVSEFNRRNRLKIVVDDPAVSQRRLAFFRGRATDPESFVAALAADPQIAIVREAPDLLRVESKREDAPQAEGGADTSADSNNAI
jgi:transmembrane sensor